MSDNLLQPCYSLLPFQVFAPSFLAAEFVYNGLATFNVHCIDFCPDGRGLTIDSGVYGSRGYEGDYMFAWIGASTPIPHKVWDLFGNLGARMYFMQIMKSDHTNQDYIRALKEKNYRLKVNECNDATLRFLKGIWKEDRIEWNSKDDRDDLI